jgi:DNA polymerase-3 subunit gamma/tau
MRTSAAPRAADAAENTAAKAAAGAAAGAIADTAADSTAGASLDWPALAATLKLTGLARELALRSELVGREEDRIRLRVPAKALLEAGGEAKLRAALREHFGRPIGLGIEIGPTAGATAAGRSEQARAVLQQQAEDSIREDPFVRELIENFGAAVDPQSIRPVPPDA